MLWVSASGVCWVERELFTHCLSKEEFIKMKQVYVNWTWIFVKYWRQQEQLGTTWCPQVDFWWWTAISMNNQQLSKKIFSVNFASSSLFKIFILKKSIQNRTYIRPSIIDFIQSSSFSNNMIDCLTNDLMHPSL